MFQTKVVEKTNVPFMFNIFVFESRVVYEMMWKNMVWPDRSQMRINGSGVLRAG